MSQSILVMAKDLVMAQIQAGQVPPDEMQNAIRQIHASLLRLKAQEETGTAGTVQEAERVPAVADWKKSITKHTVTCLVCGATFKQLSVRHFKEHGLDARSYRAKYGIPRTQPLSAKDTTARRKRIVREIKPWEKAPTYQAAQKRQGRDSRKPLSSRKRGRTRAKQEETKQEAAEQSD
jgi:predicted transcriptional regulator